MGNVKIYDTRGNAETPLYLVAEGAVNIDRRHKILVGDDAAAVLNEAFHLSSLTEERIVMLCMNASGHPIGLFRVSSGTLLWCAVRMGDLFKKALACNAANIILAHNHPSGDLTPSEQDIEITKRIVASGALLEINVLDHLIISGESDDIDLQYYSFRDSMPQLFEDAKQRAASITR